MKKFLAGWALWIIVPLQLFSASFFIWDIGASLFGFRTRPISWALREFIEISAAIGLILGLVIGAIALSRALKRNRLVENQLRAASGALAELMEERFVEWSLTPAERDVAWFTLKGFSNAEIAQMRNTSEGTVKAQSNAIFRKSGVTGRTQLMSLFIEDLLGERIEAAE